MKTLTIIAVMAVTVLVTGCGKKQSRESGASNQHPGINTNYSLIYTGMSKQIGASQVVAYGAVDTNDVPNLVMTVSEIWKGGGEASAVGITNGTQFTFRWFTSGVASQTGGHSPDHAIVIIPHGGNPSMALRGGAIFYVNDGRILGMTIQEYKAKFGL